MPFAPKGFKGMRAPGLSICFAYIGFDPVFEPAAEVYAESERDMLLGLSRALVVCTIILYSSCTRAEVAWSNRNVQWVSSAPLAKAFSVRGLNLDPDDFIWRSNLRRTSVLYRPFSWASPEICLSQWLGTVCCRAMAAPFIRNSERLI